MVKFSSVPVRKVLAIGWLGTGFLLHRRLVLLFRQLKMMDEDCQEGVADLNEEVMKREQI